MKLLIAYYSRTGGTAKLAAAIKNEFETRGHTVDVERVIPVKEHSFSGWWNIRYFKNECEILEPQIKDVSKYDAICVGSPNWTRLSLPMAGYLKTVKGLKYKNVSLFATTAFWPSIEWYVFSAFLLDLTFSSLVEEQKGRPITSILLSSFFKKWGVGSEYGEKIIEDFCDRVETPIISYKTYISLQREIEETRLLVTFFFIVLTATIILHFLSSFFAFSIVAQKQLLLFIFNNILATIFLLTALSGRTRLYLGKYVAVISLIISWTLLIVFLEPVLSGTMIFGYILVLVFMSSFRDIRAVVFAGLFSFLSYFYLLFRAPPRDISQPIIDIAFLCLAVAVVVLVTQNLKKYFFGLLEIQDEVEMAKATLEVRIEARTKELRSLAETLDEQVREKTRELQEKVEILEKFNKIAVGRELKMATLKEEIAELKKQLETAKI